MNFDYAIVFDSVQNFVGSGYLLLIVIGLLAVSLVKKVVKIAIIAGVLVALWIAANEGLLGPITASFI